MGLVAIRMAPESGVTMATFGLARCLQRRGHRVVYLANEENAQQLSANGFGVEVVAKTPAVPDDVEPLDLIADDMDRLRLSGPLKSVGRLLEAMGQAEWSASVRPQVKNWAAAVRSAMFRAAKMRAYQEHFARWIALEQPDVALVDVISPLSSAPFLRAKVPVIAVNPSFAGTPAWGFPHVFSSTIPTAAPSRLTSVRYLFEWWLFRRQFAYECAKWFIWRPLAGLSLPMDIWRSGGALTIHEFGLRIKGPELVLMPRELDFPEARRKTQRCYVGTCVDADRKEIDFSWTFLRPGKPLVVCAFGMMADRPRLLRKIIRAVIDAFRQRPEWDVLIAVPLATLGEIAELPPWVHVHFPVPQIAALSRARAFITHAGGASIKEAIFMGVPIIAFPMRSCELGHATRIAYHNLGRWATPLVIDARLVNCLLDEVTADVRIGTAVKVMQDKCGDQRELEDGARFVEAMSALSR